MRTTVPVFLVKSAFKEELTARFKVMFGTVKIALASIIVVPNNNVLSMKLGISLVVDAYSTLFNSVSVAKFYVDSKKEYGILLHAYVKNLVAE
jgi:hypothetical protein